MYPDGRFSQAPDALWCGAGGLGSIIGDMTDSSDQKTAGVLTSHLMRSFRCLTHLLIQMSVHES